MIARRALFASLLTLATAIACGCDSAEQKSHAEEERAKSEADRAEQELMANVQAALPELQKRLEKKLSTRDGVAFVNPLADFPAFPWITAVSKYAPWRVSCGIVGLNVSMPYGTREDDVDFIMLTQASLTEAQCEEFTPVIAKRVQSILDGQP
jgi:hypothetical protein